MDALFGGLFDGITRIVQQKMLFDFLVNHSATWIAAGSLLGILAFLIDIGPLKYLKADSFIGKLLLMTLCAGFLAGVLALGFSAATAKIGELIQ